MKATCKHSANLEQETKTTKVVTYPLLSLASSSGKDRLVCQWICEMIENSKYDSFHWSAWRFNNMQFHFEAVFILKNVFHLTNNAS